MSKIRGFIEILQFHYGEPTRTVSIDVHAIDLVIDTAATDTRGSKSVVVVNQVEYATHESYSELTGRIETTLEELLENK